MRAQGQFSKAAERGAAALERVGLTIFAAVLVVVMIGVLTDVQLPSVVGNAVCQVLDRDDCEAQDLTLSPLERATSGRYVAMGDSHASGEGAYDYHPDTDYDRGDDWDPRNWGDDERNRCHRSYNAYAEVVQQPGSDISFDGGFTFSACSGATQGELTGPNGSNDGEDPQLDDLDEDVSLVTMSIGGNDLGFASVVKDCIVNGERGISLVDTCQEKHAERIENRLDTLHDELVDQYREIRERAPDARIVIVGYPELFVAEPKDNYGNLLFAEDQRWMNEQGAALNDMLRAAARESGVEFIDPTDAFRGHGIGSEDAWVNDLTMGGPGISLVDPGSFHPNAEGQAALADLLEGQIKDPVYP